MHVQIIILHKTLKKNRNVNVVIESLVKKGFKTWIIKRPNYLTK